MSKQSIPQTSKRAAIYIRVSSETQAEKVSPDAQKADCLSLAEQQGYRVVDIYADLEKFRVGKRLVEPSGWRADWPQFKRMLADARAGYFDVILAWKEDRLIRGYRPMLAVSDLLEETKVDIELVKETFDRRMMGIKASMAKWELDSKRDRFLMGVAGRLAKGKAWNQASPFGYTKDSEGNYVIAPEETMWIQKLFRWYGEGLTVGEIRRRFIAAGARQRQENIRRPWEVSLLHRYLKAEHYWVGYIQEKWDGKTYHVPVPPIVSAEEVQRVLERRARFKAYPAGNAKHDALAPGLVYCKACGTRMRAHVRKGRPRKSDGGRTIWVSYRCAAYNNCAPDEGCAGLAPQRAIDKQIWDKVWAKFENPEALEADFTTFVAHLEAEETDAQKDVDQIRRALEDLKIERQRAISFATKGIITEDELQVELFGLDSQARELHSELGKAQLRTGSHTEEAKQKIRWIRERVFEGREVLVGTPETEEKAQHQIEARRQVVSEFVRRVWVHPDRSVKVEFVMDLSETECIGEPSRRCRSG